MNVNPDWKAYNAFIFDLNGTMVNDMPVHVDVWHSLMNRLGANLSREAVQAQCYGKNEELLERVFPGRFSLGEKLAIAAEKEENYRTLYRSQMQFLDGLEEFLRDAADRGVDLGIGSAAIRKNIDFIIEGLGVAPLFKAIVSADDVSHSKPDPETFLRCAELLHHPPGQCLVFEDAPKGVEAALNANMACVVLTTMHAKGEFSGYPNVIAVVPDYNTLLAGYHSR